MNNCGSAGPKQGVPQYTTPTYVLRFDGDIDLTEAESVYVTFKGKDGGVVTKTGEALTVTEKAISVYLTQAESAQLAVGFVQIQANWMDDGKRMASEIVRIEMTDNLLKQVIE